MRKSAFAIVICLILLTVHLAAQSSATVRVSGMSMRANGQIAKGYQYTGTCPVNLVFGFALNSTAPTTVSYSYKRSDGGSSNKPLSVKIPRAGVSESIYVDWSGFTTKVKQSSSASGKGWIDLAIESPNRLESKLGFTINCN